MHLPSVLLTLDTTLIDTSSSLDLTKAMDEDSESNHTELNIERPLQDGLSVTLPTGLEDSCEVLPPPLTELPEKQVGNLVEHPLCAALEERVLAAVTARMPRLLMQNPSVVVNCCNSLREPLAEALLNPLCDRLPDLLLSPLVPKLLAPLSESLRARGPDTSRPTLEPVPLITHPWLLPPEDPAEPYNASSLQPGAATR